MKLAGRWRLATMGERHTLPPGLRITLPATADSVIGADTAGSDWATESRQRDFYGGNDMHLAMPETTTTRGRKIEVDVGRSLIIHARDNQVTLHLVDRAIGLASATAILYLNPGESDEGRHIASRVITWQSPPRNLGRWLSDNMSRLNLHRRLACLFIEALLDAPQDTDGGFAA